MIASKASCIKNKKQKDRLKKGIKTRFAMFLIFLLLILIGYIFKEKIVLKSIFFFTLILFLFLTFYYALLFLYLLKSKKRIKEVFIIPEEIYNSDLFFNFKFSPLFFLTEIKLNLSTNKSEIIFNFNPKKFIFKAIPFYK